MSPSEIERFSRRLAGSADMQQCLHEMTALRRAARRMPVLHAPSAALESALFGRLNREGLYADLPRAAAPTVTEKNDRRRRAVAFATPLLLLVMVLGGYFGVSDERSRTTGGNPSGSIAFSNGFSIQVPSFAVESLGVESPGIESSRVETGSRLNIQRNDIGQSARRRSAIAPMKGLGSDISTPIDRSLPYAADLTIPSELTTQFNTVDPITVSSRSYEPSRSMALNVAPPPPSPRLIDYPRDAESSAMVASLNGGMTQLSSGDGIAMRDMQVRVGLEFGAGDRLTVIVGSSANVIETRHENMGPVSRPPGGNGVTKQLLAQPPSPHRFDINDEAWLGLGYQRPIVELSGVRVDVGANVGSSSSALRLGGDISLRRKLTKSIAFELSGTASQTIPYDRHVEQFTIFNSPDGYVYSGASQRATFYSYGVQAGITVNLSH